MLTDLSRKQQQVAELVAEGLSNPEIPAQLGISRRTVMAHLSEIYGKTGTGGAGLGARVRLEGWLQENGRAAAQPGDRSEIPLSGKELKAVLLVAAHVPRPEIAGKLGV